MCAALLVPTISHADYTTATVDSRQEQSNGLVKLMVRFTGNSGEREIVKPYEVVPASTAAETYRNLRLWAESVVRQLNLSGVAVNTPVLQPGQAIPLLAPTPPATPAENTWRGKVAMYELACTKGFLGSVATDCASLKSNIESTYKAGFLQ